MKKSVRRIVNYLVKFLLPIITVSLFFLIRLHFLDDRFKLQAFSFLSILIVIHAAIGGVWSGLVTTLFSTVFACYFYLFPNLDFSRANEETFSRVAVYIISGVVLSLFMGTFFINRKRLQTLTKTLNNTTVRLRNVMDNVFTIIAIINIKGEIIEVNKTYAEYLHKDFSEIKTHNIWEFEPWNGDNEIAQKLRQAVQLVEIDNPFKFEDNLTLDGKEIFCEITVARIKGVKTTDDIVLTVRDRSDKKRYEDELLKNSEILSRLIDSNIIGMALADLDGEFVETNQEFLDMLGYTPEEFIEKGLSWRKITPEGMGYEKLDDDKVQELRDKGFMTVFEKEYYTKNGDRIPLLITGVMINKTQVLCLMLDLSPQKLLQKQKDEFISIASHELKTPMTVIKGYLQLLSKRLNKEGIDYNDFLTVIDFQLNKMNTLVNELHDMSKIQSKKLRMNFEELKLNELVESAIKEVNPFAEKHAIVYKQVDKDIYINADLIRLEQVVINLLTNAIKYSPEGGDIIVTVSKNEDKASISVKDFGLGIPEADIKNIFTKFFQVEENRELKEGLGLGLYISSEIVKQHKGKINVESKLNEGTTFTVTIPLLIKD